MILDNYFHVDETHQLELRFGFELPKGDAKDLFAAVRLQTTGMKTQPEIDNFENSFGKQLINNLRDADLYWGGIPFNRVPEWLLEHMTSVTDEGQVQSLGACLGNLNINKNSRIVQLYRSLDASGVFCV